jgi:hypothetical protein
MRRFNKKALTEIRAESVCVCLVLLKCRTFWIQAMFPSNPHLAEFERVLILNSVHVVTHVMRDEGLQLSDKPLEHAHFLDGHESRSFQKPAVAGDRAEMVIETRKAVVSPEFSSKMLPSQVCLLTGEFGQGLRRVHARRLPAEVIAGTQARSAANFKLGHYQTVSRIATLSPKMVFHLRHMFLCERR